MATIITRAGKGSPLENDEVDSNFTNLNNDKVETSALNELVDDRVSTLIVPGLGITTDYDDTAGTLTVESDTIEELCKNGTGSTILKGTPVYQTGTSGVAMVVAPADASSAATMPAVGVLSQDLAAEAEGSLILMGRISGVDTSAFNEGDVIYVASGGGYTNTRPTGESVLVQNLGRVTKVNATNGGGVVMGSGRANDVPNLTDGNIFIGNASGTYDKRAIVTADISDLTATATELNYTDGVTSNIQTQLNTKAPLASPTFTGTVTADGLTVDDGGTLRIDASATTDFFTIVQGGTQAVLTADSPDGAGNMVFRTASAGVDATRMDIASNGDISFYEDTGTTAKLTWDASAESLNFADNGKAIFGAGNDLEIYHDGTDSIIRDGGTGNLSLRSNGAFTEIMNGGATETLARFNNNSSVQLYYDNAQKLATTATGIDVTGEITANALTINSSGIQIGTILQSTSTISARLSLMDANTTSASQVGIGATGNTLGLYAAGGTPKVVVSATGIDVTGTATMDGLTVDGSDVLAASINNSSTTAGTGGLKVNTASTSSSTIPFYVRSDEKNRLRLKGNGDFELYEDTGTTPKFFWDASAESLGIGTASPNNTAQIKTPINGGGLTLQIDSVTEGDYSQLSFVPSTADNAAPRGWIRGHRGSVSTNTYLTFGTDNAERMRIDSSGLVTVKGSGTGSVSDHFRIESTDTEAKLSFVTTTSTGAIVQSAGAMLFMTSGANTERMRIDSNGNVGIGTSSIANTVNYGTLEINGVTGSILNLKDDNVRVGSLFNTVNDVTLGNFTATGFLGFRTNSIERLRIDSSGNVLIGDSSPDITSKLTVSGNGSANTATFMYDGSSGTYLDIDTETANGSVILRASARSGAYPPLLFRVGGTERVRFDTSGNVGIGVVPEAWNSAFPSVLQVGTAASLTTSGGDNVRLFGNVWYDGTNYKRITSGYAHQYEQAGGTHRWYYAGTGAADSNISFSEAMRIDASGNFLVGTTTTSLATTEGINLSGNGALYATKDGSYPIIAGRLTSDGDIIYLRKGATKVGSIGNDTTALYVTSASTGIKFGSQAIWAVSGGGSANSNGTKDLGAATVRWKDLYLSGGVYLGGTGAANKLDDYETGTFTATVIGSSTAGSATYTTQGGTYEKIGDMVHFRLYIQWSSGTGAGDLEVGGLPFTSSSAGTSYESVAIGYIRDLTFSGVVTAYTGVNSTTIIFRENFTNAAGNSLTYDGSGRFMLSGSYRAA